MLKVIDTNCLGSGKLRRFLQSSPSNRAVLPDFVAMELYGCDDLHGIYANLSVLEDYSRQVVVLKPTRTIQRMSGRTKGLRRRLIDHGQSRDFPKFVRALRLAKKGNLDLQRQLRDYASSARSHLDGMLAIARERQFAAARIATEFSKEERRIIRDGSAYTQTLADKIMRGCLHHAHAIAEQDRAAMPRIAQPDEYPNTFTFRWAACDLLQAMRRGALGDSGNTKTTSIRNDMVDMLIVTHSTFFDGVVTAEASVMRAHLETCVLLSGMFGAHLPLKPWRMYAWEDDDI